MLAFLKCVGQSIVEHGLRGLAAMVPGGEFAYNVAKGALEKYRKMRQPAEMWAEVQELARASFEQAQQAAVQAAREVAATAPTEDIISLEMYLSQIPGSVRQSLKRPEDPTGTTVPATFVLNTPDDVLKLLPPRSIRFRPGDQLHGKPRWTLAQPLGVGGFGEVWLVRHSKVTSLTGAVKFCHDLQARDRDLLHESRVIARVMEHGKHPQIVPLLDAHLDGDPAWLMFEYVQGGDLADVIHEWQRLSKNERLTKAMAALHELAVAVGHFHRLVPAVVHRDLKPTNILRDQTTGKLRVTDFGIGGVTARAALEVETRGGMTRGGRLLSCLRGSYTPLYSSPQQRDGGEPDPRDDVHALGVIGYQMITGQLNLGAVPDFADELRDAGVAEDLVGLLGRCVAQRAERRPKDAAELAELMTPCPPPHAQSAKSSMPQPLSNNPSPRGPVQPPTPARAGTITLPSEFGFGSSIFRVLEGKTTSFRVEPVECLAAATEFNLRRRLAKENPSQAERKAMHEVLKTDAAEAGDLLSAIQQFAKDECGLPDGPRFGAGGQAGGAKKPARLDSWSFCFSYDCKWVGGRSGLQSLRARHGDPPPPPATCQTGSDVAALLQKLQAQMKPSSE